MCVSVNRLIIGRDGRNVGRYDELSGCEHSR